MRSLPEQSVNLVISSPPYSSARLYLEDGKDLGIARKPEEWVAWMMEVVKESLRVCSGLVAFVIGHGSHGCRKWTGEPALLMTDLIRAGYCLRNPIIWKRQGIQGSGSTDWKSFCPPNGIVCDPFVGTATTLDASIKLGRRFIGIDLRPSQIELCRRRIRQAELTKGFCLP
jgi:DNA modification methylase